MAGDAIDEQVPAQEQPETQSPPDIPEKSPETQRPLPNSIEIGDSFKDIQYHQGLLEIADTNEITQSWSDLQAAIRNAITQQCEIIERKGPAADELANIESIKTNIIHSIEHHERPPFTIQRLCELVIDPRRHYRMFIKYMNAIEKVLLVTSTWDEFAEHPGTNGVSGPSSSMAEGLFSTEDSMINGVELVPITFEGSDTANGNGDNSSNSNDESMDVD
ncbi:PPP4R2-domain-containing protein [Fennellomyces sp. T-0311]|nr:PPP4R2-domain-containing protein [Fennellomyces sp. T-0311]